MASSSKPSAISISSFPFTFRHSSNPTPTPVPGPSTISVPIPKPTCPLSEDPVWCSFYTIRQTRAWNSVLDIGSLGFHISHSQASFLPKSRNPFFTLPPQTNKQIPTDLYEDAAKALTWVWEFSECQLAIKLLADRLSDCWFGGLSELLTEEAPEGEAVHWTLAVLETLDFLTRTLQTYESFDGRLYIFQALSAFHEMFNFSDQPAGPSESDSASEFWIQIRGLVIQILYRIHPEDHSYRTLAIRAQPLNDQPIYVTLPFKRFLTAILCDYWRPIIDGTESIDASICDLRSGHRFTVPIPNFVGEQSVPASSSFSYLEDYHSLRPERLPAPPQEPQLSQPVRDPQPQYRPMQDPQPQYQPMDLNFENVLDTQAWDATIWSNARSVAPFPARAPPLRLPPISAVVEQALQRVFMLPVLELPADTRSLGEPSVALDDQLPPIGSEPCSLPGRLSDPCSGDGPQLGLTSLSLGELPVDKPDDEAGSSASSEDSNEAAEVSLMLTAGRLSTIAGSDRCSSPLGSPCSWARSPSPLKRSGEGQEGDALGQSGPSRSLSPIALLISQHGSAEPLTDPSPLPSLSHNDIDGRDQEEAPHGCEPAEPLTDPSLLPSLSHKDIVGRGQEEAPHGCEPPRSDLDELDWPSPPASPSPLPVKGSGVGEQSVEAIWSQFGPRRIRSSGSRHSWPAGRVAKEKQPRKSDCGGTSEVIRAQPLTSSRWSPTSSQTRLCSVSGPDPHAQLRTSPRRGPPGTEAIGRSGLVSRAQSLTSPRRSPTRSSARSELGAWSGPASLMQAPTAPRRMTEPGPTSAALPPSTPCRSPTMPVLQPGPASPAQAQTTPGPSTPPGPRTAEPRSVGPTPTIPSPPQTSEAPTRPNPEPEARPRVTRSRAKAQMVSARRSEPEEGARDQPITRINPSPSPAKKASPLPQLAPQPLRRVTRSRAQAQAGLAGRVNSNHDVPARKRQVRTRPSARVMEDLQDTTSAGVGALLGKRKRGPVGQAAPGEQSGAGEVPDKGKKRTRASGRVSESERGVREVVGRKATGAGRGKKSGLGGGQVRRSTRRTGGVVVKEETREEEVVAESSVAGRKRTRSGGVKRTGQAAEEVVEGEPEEPVGRKRTKTGGARRSVQETSVKVEEEEVEWTTQPKGVKASKRSKPAAESERRKQRLAPTAPGEASGLRPTRRTAKRGESTKVKKRF